MPRTPKMEGYQRTRHQSKYFWGSHEFVFNPNFWDKFLNQDPVKVEEKVTVIPDLQFQIDFNYE